MSVSQPSKLRSHWNKACQWLKALPFKAQIVLGIFLLAAVLLALHTSFSSKDSSLHLRLQHGYRNAQLSLLIDGRKVYAGKLVGYSRKKYALFGETVEGNLSQVFAVASGTHEILVRIEPGDGTVQEETVSGVFASGVGRDLSVTARHSGLIVSWQGDTEAAVAESPAETRAPNWFSKYAGSLFLTIAGSIASAITGFAIREVPAYLRTRQAAGPKPPSEVAGD